MKRYEARLAHDLNAIQKRVAGIADAVRAAVNEAVVGLETFDKDRLYDVILNDHPINRESRAIDAMCHAFVARHLPAAGPFALFRRSSVSTSVWSALATTRSPSDGWVHNSTNRSHSR